LKTPGARRRVLGMTDANPDSSNAIPPAFGRRKFIQVALGGLGALGVAGGISWRLLEDKDYKPPSPHPKGCPDGLIWA